MKEIAQDIRRIISVSKDKLNAMTSDTATYKETPDSWSKKEILGHLIDSASNNHQRFVRACYNEASDFPPYNQTEWVRVQQHNNAEWSIMVELWVLYNLYLCDFIERIPEEQLSSPVNIGKEEPVPLEFVMKDYLGHLRQHMNDIVPIGK